MPFLLFDFDGTIADTFNDSLEIYNRLAEEMNLRKVQPEEVDELRSLAALKILERLQIPLAQIPKLITRGINELHGRMERVQPFHGMCEVLNGLEGRGVLLGILTSNSVPNVQLFLKRGGFPKFQIVKQASRIFGKASDLKAIRRKLKKAELPLIYVGDEKRDIDASRSANVPVAAVSWGYNSRQSLADMNPDYMIDQPEQLLDLAEGLPQS